jgi:hypothetical protein
MKNLLFFILVSAVLFTCCRQHVQPIKWEKPGDELVGEWIWTKAFKLTGGKKVEFTDLGAFINNPSIKCISTAIFKVDKHVNIILESSGILDTLKGTWGVNGDTLKIDFIKNRKKSLSIYKMDGNEVSFTHFEDTTTEVYKRY